MRVLQKPFTRGWRDDTSTASIPQLELEVIVTSHRDGEGEGERLIITESEQLIDITGMRKSLRLCSCTRLNGTADYVAS